MKIIKNRLFIFLTIILMIAGFFIYINSQNQAKSKKSKEGLQPYTVEKMDLSSSLTLSGKIAAAEIVNLRFQTSGRLNWVGVKTGDYVKKFQNIASLDVRELKKTLQKKLDAYLSERYDFDQSRDDNIRNSDTAGKREERDEAKRLLQKAQLDLNSTVSDVELQTISMEYANLITPIEGIVTKVAAPYAGVNITPLTAEFEIINPKTVYLSVSADQNEVVDIKPGMNVEITLDAYPDEKLISTVSAVSFTPKTGESGTVYEIKVPIKDTSDPFKYKIDMTADATFIIGGKKDVLAIPSTFLKEKDGKYFVNIDIKDKNKQKEVQIGEEYDEFTEIASGLLEGDVIYD